jgi:peroxiredoxin
MNITTLLITLAMVLNLGGGGTTTLTSTPTKAIKDELALGAKAPLMSVKMLDVSGKKLSLSDVKGENGLLVVFSSNTCPWVLAWEDRYLEIAKLAKQKNIGMIAINSNEASRKKEDSYAEMQKHAKDKGYTFPYVVDTNHRLADEYGATKTPHIYLFDKNNTLVYRGAIDDSAKDLSKIENRYLSDAINAMTSGASIKTTTSKALGCTIKRVEAN